MPQLYGLKNANSQEREASWEPDKTTYPVMPHHETPPTQLLSFRRSALSNESTATVPLRGGDLPEADTSLLQGATSIIQKRGGDGREEVERATGSGRV